MGVQESPSYGLQGPLSLFASSPYHRERRNRLEAALERLADLRGEMESKLAAARLLEAGLDRLDVLRGEMIAQLDAGDLDPDLEPEALEDSDADQNLGGVGDAKIQVGWGWQFGEEDDGEPDREATLGPSIPHADDDQRWTWRLPSSPVKAQVRKYGGRLIDIDDAEHDGREPDFDGERTLGWSEAESVAGGHLSDDDDGEPETGSLEVTDQRRWGHHPSGLAWACTDGGEPNLASLGGTATGIHQDQRRWFGTGRDGIQNDDREEASEDEGDPRHEICIDDPLDFDPRFVVEAVSGVAAGGGRPSTADELLAQIVDPASLPPIYAMVCCGTCMEPELSDGVCLAFDSTAPVAPGDLAVVYIRPEHLRPGEWPGQIKRIVSLQGTGNDVADLEPLLMVEQLNPPTMYAYPRSRIWAVHRCLGPVERTSSGAAVISQSLIDAARA